MAVSKGLTSCVLLALFCSSTSCLASIIERNQHTTVILFGANGNLATKYLWQSIFDVYTDKAFASVENDAQSNCSFNFIGVGRSLQEEGTARLNSKLSESIDCGVSVHGSPSKECMENKMKFINIVEYLQFTDGTEGYTLFCNHVQKTLAPVDSEKKMKVIMYMAISTTAYVSFLENFKKICHSRILLSDIDFQWALEKPFGVDKMSAHSFADKIETLYDENEIHHIDHYLQKSVVKTILPFRYLNKELDKIWNKDHVERVEIFLKETLDVKDRATFYNSMGVLRDIHQSHLTELLTLVAMEIPTDIANAGEINRRKGDLIRLVESAKGDHSVFGQYSEYATHVSMEMSNDTKTSDVPTFGAVVLRVNEARWKGVPFILVSGKQLDRRESYVRVVFKDRRVCVSGCYNKNQAGYRGQMSKRQVVFHIGHGDLTRPAILVSKSLGKKILWPSNILDISSAELDGLLNNGVEAYDSPVGLFFVGLVNKDLPAYHSIMADLVDDTNFHFVNTQRLLLSWHIWDFVVTSGNKEVRIYDRGDKSGVLNFSFDDENRLIFDLDVAAATVAENDTAGKGKYRSDVGKGVDVIIGDEVQTQSPALFLGWKLVTSTSSLLPTLLANAIADAAREEIKIKGSFHIALSGGSSVGPVLSSLAASSSSLPWDLVHVWQVDERCVPHHNEQSNFGALERELIRRVDIPFTNIHAMPVDIAGDLCDDSLGGAHLYTEAVRTHVLNGRLDMTVLGLGTDGHTASLFPGSSSLNVDSDTWVTITDDGPDGLRRRMTLTLPLINQSKRVAVLVTGSHKSNILRRLESSRSVDHHPILGVRPANGTLAWYIDDLALTPPE